VGVLDTALDEAMPPANTRPNALHEAMRYAVFTGGKRLRPILCLAACKAVSGSTGPACLPALAVELLHTYTLVHDDLPSMDNDTLRRGKPTVHVKFGEANAILTGDALQALAFELLSRSPAPSNWPSASFVMELARAAGSQGVVGGQIEDLAGNGGSDTEAVRQIHLRKTAGLFRAALRIGGMAGNGTEDEVDALGTYGISLGMAFQITDDLLDSVEENAADPGEETTCLSVYEPEQARHVAMQYIDTAVSALAIVPDRNRRPLEAIANYVVESAH